MKSPSLGLLATLALTALAPGAVAADATACIDDHESGQVLRKESRFLAAKQRFLACAADACPPMVRSDCAALASEMDAAIPSVVLAAVDGRGEDVRGATVRVDGAEPRPLDGRALPLDPGGHRFVFEAPGVPSREVTVALREAERFRRVGAVLDVEAPDDAGLRVHPLALVFGGVGAAATASFAFFALNGKATERSIRRCDPSCTGEDVDTMRREYLIADISLLVALGSFSVGTWFFLHPPGSAEPSREPARAASTRLEWAPVLAPGVAAITASGAF